LDISLLWIGDVCLHVAAIKACAITAMRSSRLAQVVYPLSLSILVVGFFKIEQDQNGYRSNIYSLLVRYLAFPTAQDNFFNANENNNLPAQ